MCCTLAACCTKQATGCSPQDPCLCCCLAGSPGGQGGWQTSRVAAQGRVAGWLAAATGLGAAEWPGTSPSGAPAASKYGSGLQLLRPPPLLLRFCGGRKRCLQGAVREGGGGLAARTVQTATCVAACCYTHIEGGLSAAERWCSCCCRCWLLCMASWRLPTVHSASASAGSRPSRQANRRTSSWAAARRVTKMRRGLSEAPSRCRHCFHCINQVRRGAGTWRG